VITDVVINQEFAKVFACYENIEIVAGPGKLMPDMDIKYSVKKSDFKGIMTGF
jgi:hypothetical protein